MVRRTIGVDLAPRRDHVARVFDNGLSVGKSLRFRLTGTTLAGFVARVTADLLKDRATAVAESRAIVTAQFKIPTRSIKSDATPRSRCPPKNLLALDRDHLSGLNETVMIPPWQPSGIPHKVTLNQLSSLSGNSVRCKTRAPSATKKLRKSWPNPTPGRLQPDPLMNLRKPSNRKALDQRSRAKWRLSPTTQAITTTEHREAPSGGPHPTETHHSSAS